MNNFETTPQFNPDNQPGPSVPVVVEQGKEALKRTKEKISFYLKYKGLKVREYFGQLNQESFNQLLNFDFQEQLKDNPPIEGVFSPKDELNKIKSLPKKSLARTSSSAKN